MATLVGWYAASTPSKWRLENVRNSSPRDLSREEKSFTATSPRNPARSGLSFGASSETFPSAEIVPPVRRIFTFSVKYGCTGPIGRAFARSLAWIDGGSTEKAPPRETLPFRSYRVEKENLPGSFPPMAMFSAFSRSRSRAISTGGSVVRSSSLAEYRSTTVFLMVIFHGCPPGPFPGNGSPARPSATGGSAGRVSSARRRVTFVFPMEERRMDTVPFAVATSPITISFFPGSTSPSFTSNPGMARNSSFSSR